MPIQIAPFAPDHLPAVARLCERTFARPRGEDFVRWRYLEAPAHRGFVALRGDECLALLCAFERPYRLGEERVPCLEICDWHCLPELRASGLGIRLMRLAMQGPEPIVAVGGTEDTVSLLPRLGFERLGCAEARVLPLRAGALTAPLARRARVPEALAAPAAALALRTWFRVRPTRAPRGGAVLPVACPGPELEALYARSSDRDFLPLPDLAHLRWLTGSWPGAGQFLTLYFTLGEALRGWALARVSGAGDACAAALVEVFAPDPDEALYAWMVSEALARVAAFRPARVSAQAACPALDAALARHRFLRTGSDPVVWWAPGRKRPAGPLHVTLNHADGALIPYPQRWWPEPRG